MTNLEFRRFVYKVCSIPTVRVETLEYSYKKLKDKTGMGGGTQCTQSMYRYHGVV